MLVLRNEDLDRDRCRPEFVKAMIEDLRWFGFEWREGPDCGGACGPYTQSERQEVYKEAFRQLRAAGVVYPCACSRRDVQRAVQAPHLGDEEPIYPGTCRPPLNAGCPTSAAAQRAAELADQGGKVCWRFRVPDEELVNFVDGAHGPKGFRAGIDFGDFVVWRHDGVPSYQLAVTVDDGAMGITEVVRGDDLLISTARQILLYRAFGWTAPAFFHCRLMHDEHGVRLAKRHDALSLRALRQMGRTPEELRRLPGFEVV